MTEAPASAGKCLEAPACTLVACFRRPSGRVEARVVMPAPLPERVEYPDGSGQRWRRTYRTATGFCYEVIG